MVVTTSPTQSEPKPSAEPLLDKLVEDLESLNLPEQDFGHRQHVQAAWMMLELDGLVPTLERFPRAIRRFAEHHGASGLYHETITWYFLLLVNERREQLPAGHAWQDFEDECPDLLTGARRKLLSVYSESRLDSDLARRVFLLPDRAATDRREGAMR